MHDHPDSDRSRCPACGHELSMYREPEAPRSERLAAAVADHVATWWFSALVVTFLVAWVAANAIWRPFEPYPVVVLAVISAVLASIAALQGPLILVTQRRSSERDRMRDREQLRVSTNAEADLHRVERKLDALLEAIASIRDAR